MYEVFDSFCKIPTWATSHALDERRFRAALSEVIHLADFSPEEMGRYIQMNHAEPIWPKTAAQLNKVIDRLVEYATVEQRRIGYRLDAGAAIN
jgi:hypothetical protein